MRTEFILLVIVGGFLSSLLVFLILVYKPVIPMSFLKTQNKNTSQAASSESDVINSLKSKVKSLETNQRDQDSILQDLKAFVATQSAKPTAAPAGKSILAVASTKGSAFTTSSADYTPMGMYVNINCSKNCSLWIDFYTSSKNSGTPNSAQGYVNTYDVFLDNADQSVYSQASYHAAASAVPVSINVMLSAAAGNHTIDIRAKTTGGTLQSDSSALQVMAIER